MHEFESRTRLGTHVHRHRAPGCETITRSIFATAVFMALAFAAPEIHAYATTGTLVVVNDDDGGGHYAVAEYSTDPMYALGTIQGTSNQVDSRAWHHYMFSIGGSFNTNITLGLTYTLLAEAFVTNGASIFSKAAVFIGECFAGTCGIPFWSDRVTLDFSGEGSATAEIIHDTPVTIDKRDQFGRPDTFRTGRTYYLELQTEIHGNTYFLGPDAFFSATAYADPVLSFVSGQAGGQTIDTFFPVPGSHTQVSGDPPGNAPEPATLALLALGLAGVWRRRTSPRLSRKRAPACLSNASGAIAG